MRDIEKGEVANNNATILIIFNVICLVKSIILMEGTINNGEGLKPEASTPFEQSSVECKLALAKKVLLTTKRSGKMTPVRIT